MRVSGRMALVSGRSATSGRSLDGAGGARSRRGAAPPPRPRARRSMRTIRCPRRAHRSRRRSPPRCGTPAVGGARSGASRSDDSPPARLALVRGHQVELVEHQPALLAPRAPGRGRPARRARCARPRPDRRHPSVARRRGGAARACGPGACRNRSAQALALGRPFDQAGDVGHDEASMRFDRHDAEVRDERRERVVGDLGAGLADLADERGLARVRLAEQADVGQHAQLQLELAPRARRAVGGAARRPVGRALEARVAQPPEAALRDQCPLAGGREIGDAFVGLQIDAPRCRRAPHHEIVAAAAPEQFRPRPFSPRFALQVR